jgi:hypothetical protein
MGSTRILIFSLFMMLIPCIASAYSLQNINQLLSGYNVSASLISSLEPVTLAYSSKAYVGMYDSSGNLDFLVNVSSSSYSLVLNSTAVFNIIRNYTISTILNKTNFGVLSVKMHRYENSSSGLLDECFDLTGLSNGDTCTLANYCESCLTVPICKCDLTGYGCPAGSTPPGGGAGGIFGTGIMQFESDYNMLNASFGIFYSSISSISKDNAATNIARIDNAFANISNITINFYKNVLFPPSANVTPDMLAGCSNYISQTNAPWFCNEVGYCESLSYNYTLLASIQAQLNAINMLPLSNTQILQLAQNTTKAELDYAYPVLSNQKLTVLDAMLNASLPNYKTLVNNSVVLLSHVNNGTLMRDLLILESNYSNTVKNYFSLNLTQANRTLAVEFANLSKVYSVLNSSYSSVLSIAENNTAKILELQLSNSGGSQDLGNLAFAELALNSEITASNITNTTAIGGKLSALSSRLSGYSASPITFAEIARGIDGAFIRVIAKSFNLSYQGGVSLAPIIGSLLSLIIGAILVLIIVIFRSNLKRNRKLVVNPKTAKNWRSVFIFLILCVVLYVEITYSLLSYASTFAPFGAFKNVYSSSSSLVVAINGTPTAGEYVCTTKINAQAQKEGKTVELVQFSNGSCKAGNTTLSTDSCLNSYAETNIPVIVLSYSSQDKLNLYSLYGTVLSASGNDTVMSSCYVSLFLAK